MDINGSPNSRKPICFEKCATLCFVCKLVLLCLALWSFYSWSNVEIWLIFNTACVFTLNWHELLNLIGNISSCGDHLILPPCLVCALWKWKLVFCQAWVPVMLTSSSSFLFQTERCQPACWVQTTIRKYHSKVIFEEPVTNIWIPGLQFRIFHRCSTILLTMLKIKFVFKCMIFTNFFFLFLLNLYSGNLMHLRNMRFN